MRLSGYGLRPWDIGFDVPGDSFRPNQLELAEQIINSTKDVILLIGPTGLGKSLINRIPGRVLGQRTLILTRTIQLQDQYGEQDELPVLMGRNRYICNRWPEVSAADAVCRAGIKCGLMFTGECDYYRERDKAKHAETAVLNYAVFFRFTSSSEIFRGWDWVVLDEAHALPAELTSAFSLAINMADLRKFRIVQPITNDVHGWQMWAINNESKIQKLIGNRERKINREDIQPLYRLLAATQALKFVHDSDNWVLVVEENSIRIAPIWPNTLAKAGIWDHGSKFILSSATVEPYMVQDMLGIEQDQMDILSVGSDFPIDSRPINILARHSVNRAMSDETIEALIQDIDNVMDKYEGKRGLIHTGNYKLSLTIAERSRNQDRLMYHDSDNRLEMFEIFKSKEGEGKVLLSPAMIEGVDLPYDACRFQIVAKIPFEDIGGYLWQARFKSDTIRARLAYTGNAISAIVQACGRGMRAYDDYCDTWILDQSFNRVRAESNYRFPKFFVEAVRYVDYI